MIVLDNPPLYIRGNPCIDRIISTAEDVGKVDNSD